MPTAKQTKQDGEDTKLILYRLDRVEGAVKDVGITVASLDYMKQSDMKVFFADFKETILGRVTSLEANFQRQLDGKADATSVSDIKKLIGAVVAVFGSIIGALVVYFITRPAR